MTNNSIPFTAAIFDLDGTLLDSVWVWREVDRAFFKELGIAEPEDYARSVQGMSFRETAEYTVRRFDLSRTVEEVMDGWMRTTAEAYAHRVALKPGALSYLRALKRAGVKLAVASANREDLFGPTLRRCGAWELFDAVCTSAEVGDARKDDGALFLLAAQKLGIAPAECVVFEDTLEGVLGARRAGMGVYAVRDAGNDHHPEKIAALADGVMDDFTQMERFHDLPERRRCVIFTARCDGDVKRAYQHKEGDWVLCADGGWHLARQAGVRPDLVMGDFDSSEQPGEVPVERFPVEKDDTDTMLCLKKGLAMGYDNFLIVGGFGGRIDHTLGNLQALRYAADRAAAIEMCDGESWATVVAGGAVRVPADVIGSGPVKLSVFALDRDCRDVCIRGTKWEAEDATWTNGFPLGVSNEFTAECAEISLAEGALLVTVCREEQPGRGV